MDTFLLAARLVLALVFIVAGAMKLAALAASIKAVRDLGVPDFLARPIAIVLPFIEIAIALAVLSSTLAWWGATASLLLLLTFIAVVSINLARGRTVNCRCFGPLSNDAIGLPALLRNQMLAAVAILLMWQGWTSTGPNVLSWFASITIADRIRLTVGVVLLCLFAARKQLLELLRRRPLMQGRLPLTAGTATRVNALSSWGMFPVAGLPVGTVAPNSDLVRSNHLNKVNLHSLFDQGKPVMLVFIDPDCDTCRALLPEINYWSSRYFADLTISVITRANAGSVEFDGASVLFQREREVAESFKVAGFPTAVIVGPDGLVASRLAFGAEAIRLLMADTVHIADARHYSTTVSGCGTCGH